MQVIGTYTYPYLILKFWKQSGKLCGCDPTSNIFWRRIMWSVLVTWPNFTMGTHFFTSNRWQNTCTRNGGAQRPRLFANNKNRRGVQTYHLPSRRGLKKCPSDSVAPHRSWPLDTHSRSLNNAPPMVIGFETPRNANYTWHNLANYVTGHRSLEVGCI